MRGHGLGHQRVLAGLRSCVEAGRISPRAPASVCSVTSANRLRQHIAEAFAKFRAEVDPTSQSLIKRKPGERYASGTPLRYV